MHVQCRCWIMCVEHKRMWSNVCGRVLRFFIWSNRLGTGPPNYCTLLLDSANGARYNRYGSGVTWYFTSNSSIKLHLDNNPTSTIKHIRKTQTAAPQTYIERDKNNVKTPVFERA